MEVIIKKNKPAICDVIPISGLTTEDLMSIFYYLLGGGSGPNVEVLVNKKEIKIRKGDKTMMKELYNIYIY